MTAPHIRTPAREALYATRTPADLPPDVLGDLASVVTSHAAALSKARALGDARAVATYRARAAGATWGQLAKVLGIPRPTVVDLARRGERLAPEKAAVPSRVLAIQGSPEPGPSDEPRAYGPESN